MSNVDLRAKKGLVATVVITGQIDQQFSHNLSNMRSWADRAGYHAIEWRNFDAKFVEAGRDSAAKHALSEGYEWILQIDADAAPFPPEALERFLSILFVEQPSLDAVGAYCQLKQYPHLCTIDTGTGTWEEHYPGEGLLPVIRTGGHFLMCNTRAFRRFGPPWFRTRNTLSPAKAFLDVDNFARTKLDGNNPLANHPEWVTLLAEARRVSMSEPALVGEDSGFCDALMAAGGRIAVDTGVVAGHIGTKIIKPDDLYEFMEEARDTKKLVVGVIP